MIGPLLFAADLGCVGGRLGVLVVGLSEGFEAGGSLFRQLHTCSLGCRRQYHQCLRVGIKTFSTIQR